MSKALVLVEGETDYGVVTTLMRRLRSSSKARRMRGNRIEKLLGFINSLGGDYDKFIIMKDLHRYRRTKILERFNRLRKQLSRAERRRTKLVIVKKAIESWLLADPSAISKAFGCRRKIVINNPEEVENPVEVLDSILKKSGKRYFKGRAIASKIAEELDPETAAKRSKSFEDFYGCLQDP